jgi:hypothetical protein
VLDEMEREVMSEFENFSRELEGLSTTGAPAAGAPGRVSPFTGRRSSADAPAHRSLDRELGDASDQQARTAVQPRFTASLAAAPAPPMPTSPPPMSTPERARQASSAGARSSPEPATPLARALQAAELAELAAGGGGASGGGGGGDRPMLPRKKQRSAGGDSPLHQPAVRVPMMPASPAYVRDASPKPTTPPNASRPVPAATGPSRLGGEHSYAAGGGGAVPAAAAAPPPVARASPVSGAIRLGDQRNSSHAFGSAIPSASATSSAVSTASSATSGRSNNG